MDKIKATNFKTGEIIKGDRFSVSKYLRQEGFNLTDEYIQIEDEEEPKKEVYKWFKE